MSFLRGSANYVWCTTSVLGKGATGAVFQGVNKHTGETVAVKTFNQLSHMRPQEVQMREFEVLQKVKHENIVKLLAIEEEQEGRGKVIVMELCTGGSLFNLLDDPENNFGLDEDEWLLVLSHLSAGMNHLRDNSLVHRDLKPGNIMKFIKDCGEIVYKLTDFGAARELQDDQQFVSLYGTEEYLHPDMYERAVLRKPVGKTFGATVDLWSIGVTLYHVATGNLPFRPFGGRRNKETMYHITTKKASGVISGVQTSENGPIQWSRDLPGTCLLSQGIRRHVTPLLAGLLEVNPQKMWTFERFFSEVTRILSKKKMHIYYMNRLSEVRVYLDKTERLENFQLLLTEQTEVDPVNQILLHRDNFLSHHVDTDTPGTSFPDTSLSDPIVLFSKDSNNVTLGGIGGGGGSVAGEREVPAFPALPNLVSVENDATLAKSACAVGYAHRRRVEAHARCADVTSRAVRWLAEVVGADLERLLEVSDRCRAQTRMAESQVALFESAHSAQTRMLECAAGTAGAGAVDEWRRRAGQIVSEDSRRLRQMRQRLDELAPAVEQLNRRHVADHRLVREWKESTRELPPLGPCAVKARTYVGKLKESWQHLLRDRASRTLTYNDEQFHILEKIKMQETMRVMSDLLSKESQPAVTALTESLADWYKMAQTTFLQAEILRKDVSAYEDEVEAFAVAAGTVSKDRYEVAFEEALASVKAVQAEQQAKSAAAAAAAGDAAKLKMNGTVAASPSSSANNGHGGSNRTNGRNSSDESRAKVRKALRSILATQDEVWGIMNENNRLIEQFGQLAAAASSSSSDEQILLDAAATGASAATAQQGN